MYLAVRRQVQAAVVCRLFVEVMLVVAVKPQIRFGKPLECRIR